MTLFLLSAMMAKYFLANRCMVIHLIFLIAGQPNFYIPKVVTTLNTRIFQDAKDIKCLNH
jgi:hypothetical protein